jgi:hypothetical protein
MCIFFKLWNLSINQSNDQLTNDRIKLSDETESFAI